MGSKEAVVLKQPNVNPSMELKAQWIYVSPKTLWGHIRLRVQRCKQERFIVLIGLISILLLADLVLMDVSQWRLACQTSTSVHLQRTTLVRSHNSRHVRTVLSTLEEKTYETTNNTDLRQRLPQSIIVGVRKCGTRALLTLLSLHPAIKIANEEVHFFDNDDNYYLGLDWYRRKMPYTYADQVTVEKSPAYYITENVPKRIHKMNKDIKILVIYRNPVVRTISDYAQIVANKKAKNKTHEAFEDLAIDPDTGLVNTRYKAIKISVYHRNMRRWLRLYPRHQIHIIDGDNLIKRPIDEVRKIETFLNLEHRVTEDNVYYNGSRGFYCFRNTTSPSSHGACLKASKGRKHPFVKPEVIQKLDDYFKPHNRKLFKMIGHEFDW